MVNMKQMDRHSGESKTKMKPTELQWKYTQSDEEKNSTWKSTKQDRDEAA